MKTTSILLFIFFVSSIFAQTKFYVVSQKEKSKSRTKKEIKRIAKFKKKYGTNLGGYFNSYGESDTTNIRLNNERLSKELKKYWSVDDLDVIFLSKEELKEQKQKKFEKSFLVRIRYNSGKKNGRRSCYEKKNNYL